MWSENEEENRYKMKPSNGKQYVSKNLHLLISVILILIIGLTYGICPDKILPKLFNFRVETTDLKHIFRALMGLYLGMSIIWIVGIVKPGFWIMATLTNIIFMGGLAIGRLLSLLIDGFPSTYFIIGLVLELMLAFWGILNLTWYSRNTNLISGL